MGGDDTGKSTAERTEEIGRSGRTVTVRPDGSSFYVARANVGDCYWRVAEDVLMTRKGEVASAAEISAFVSVLAEHNKKEDANLLLVGEKIEIPPAS